MENYPIILNNEESSSTVGDYATTIGATVLTFGTFTIMEEIPDNPAKSSSNAELHTIRVASASYYSLASDYQEKTSDQETASVVEIEESLESTGVLTLKDWLPRNTYLVALPNVMASSDCDRIILNATRDVLEKYGLDTEIILPNCIHGCDLCETQTPAFE